MKTVDFSETIAACDLKVGRCIQIIKLTKNVSIEGQGHFLTLAQSHLNTKLKLAFLINQRAISTKFQVQGNENLSTLCWSRDQDDGNAQIW